MRSLHLLVMSLVLLAAPAARGDEAAAAARATLRRVAAMTPQQQQAWLRELKSRLDWANRLALSPADAVRQEARVAAMLHQKTVSMQALLELVRESNTRERDAVAEWWPSIAASHIRRLAAKARSSRGAKRHGIGCGARGPLPAVPATSKTA